MVSEVSVYAVPGDNPAAAQDRGEGADCDDRRDIGTVVPPRRGTEDLPGCLREVRAAPLHRGPQPWKRRLPAGRRVSAAPDEIRRAGGARALKAAEDAVVIDSDKMTVYEVVEYVMGLLKTRKFKI